MVKRSRSRPKFYLPQMHTQLTSIIARVGTVGLSTDTYQSATGSVYDVTQLSPWPLDPPYLAVGLAMRKNVK